MKDDMNSVINQFDNSLQRSHVLASQVKQINRLQSKQLGGIRFLARMRRRIASCRTMADNDGQVESTFERCRTGNE